MVMTWRQRALDVFVVGSAAFGLGALESLIKGQGNGLLGALSETVVPWFLLAFLAGAVARDRRYAFGAFVGVAATMMALVGFYFVNGFIFHYWATTWVAGFHDQVAGGKVYFELGLFSGALCGAFGAWWKRHLSMIPVIALGVAFVIEALARAALTNSVFGYADQVAAIELIVGALWIALALVATFELRHRHELRRLG
jgi:hypothetical protein